MAGAADFAALGLAPGATVDAAKSAFKRLALVHHPDKGGSAAKFREISSAFSAIAEAAGRADEADALLADPLADILGANWARGFADGSVDPMQAMEAARVRLSAELGAVDPLVEAAAELGLGHMSAAELRKLAGAAGADDGELGGELGGGGDGLGETLGGAAGADASSNMFKAFFDAMPEEERGPMLALFEKTFPAFLAEELQEQQHPNPNPNPNPNPTPSPNPNPNPKPNHSCRSSSTRRRTRSSPPPSTRVPCPVQLTVQPARRRVTRPSRASLPSSRR